MFVIQKTMNYITISLVHIFNLCFETGEFPSKMKISKVLPISKKGKKDDMSNYRPIVIPNMVSKQI